MNQLYMDRLARVCSRLREQGLTQMIVSDPLSIGYLTGVWIEPTNGFLPSTSAPTGNTSSF